MSVLEINLSHLFHVYDALAYYSSSDAILSLDLSHLSSLRADM